MSIWKKLIPSGLVDHFRAEREKRAIHQRRTEFYKSFLAAGDLVFDIGANVGERVAALLDAGCRVVAVEPQARCCSMIRAIQARPGFLNVISKACGAGGGTARLKSAGGTDVLASLSEDYIRSVSDSGRFSDHRWDTEQTVDLCSADELIKEFGLPRFIKIDVEGYEEKVFEGLHRAPQILSFEFTPELAATMQRCIDHCERLGLTEFNISYGESMAFARREWIGAAQIRSIIEALAGDTQLFGDVFARVRTQI